MKVVFVDTGHWVAVLNPKDDWNSRAISASRSLGKVRLVTTEMVLDELLAALSKLPVRPFVTRGVEAIRGNPNIEVVPQTSLQFSAAFDDYQRMTDKEWSLTDCASFALMKERGVSEALAHDQHFEQAGFVALLRA
ncbi:MAG: type II toxin-antitoxin system VapC family toxin [Sterolibacteriaceae bacterium]|uniref:Type II toxin-antitoxin system VapC family toxin n=1 Tax=Candidatus Methylophosphatis roskildensis TaxID=2899263 RepID=A0A9D7E7I9_9PROT|nr:type II toxin-antitoxin system VapC family toxin [Candidatus Methylophosphatis roskildensis]MBK7235388.1 type II toxin-antitoxin system VapC family toxin [Sterolibacteriaceae bacterium]